MGEKKYIQKDNKRYRVETTLYGEKKELVSEKGRDGKWHKVSSNTDTISGILQVFVWIFFGLFMLIYYLFVWIFNKKSKDITDTTTELSLCTHNEKMQKLSIQIENEKTKKRKLQIGLFVVIIVCLVFMVIPFFGGLGVFSSIREKNIEYKVIYYASTGGCIGIPSKNTKYSVSYTFNIKSGNNCEYVEAVPNDGYEFYKWSDGNYNSIRQEKNVKSNLSITAYFRLKQNSVGQNLTITYIANDCRIIPDNVNQTEVKYLSGNYIW